MASIHEKRQLQEAPLGKAQASGGVTQIAADKPGMLENLAKDKAAGLVKNSAGEFLGGAAQGFGNAQAASALGVDAASGIGLGAFGGPGAAVSGTGVLGAGAGLGSAAGGAGLASAAPLAAAAAPIAAPLIGGALLGKAFGLFNQGGNVSQMHYDKGGSTKGSIWDSVKKAASYAWKNDNLRDSSHPWAKVGTDTIKTTKPAYKAIGGMTSGPLGMSDALMAGKDKAISKVKIKKNKGDMSEEVEFNYHAPLAPKPTGE